MRVYREWKLSGDDDFLRELWPNMKKVMGYAERVWDPDGDGVLEGPQHNTYDIDFFGVSTLPNAIYLASLRAAQAMASFRNAPARGRPPERRRRGRVRRGRRPPR